MKTVTIDIINEKAIDLLKELESLKLIRFNEGKKKEISTDWLKYKGAMSKQSPTEIERQLNEMRSEWD